MERELSDFLGLLAQNIINVTDTAFLGRVGEVELGASAMGGLFYICVFTIAFGFSIGSQILIARRNGEGRYKDVGPVMIQGGTFLLGLAVLMFGLTHLLAPSVVRLLISSDSILTPPWNSSTGVSLVFLRFYQRDVPCAVYWHYTY